MTKRLVWLTIVVIIIITIFSSIAYKKNNTEEFKPINLNTGDEFTAIAYPNTMYVLNYVIVDFNGDGEKDMLILIGEKKNIQDTFSENMDVVLYDKVSKNFTKAELKKYSGNNPKLIIGDFTGDAIIDLFVIAQNENIYQVRGICYKDGKLDEIFKNKDNMGLNFSGQYLDGYKVKVENKKYNREFTLDLNDRKENYMTKKLYDDAGRLLNTEQKPTITRFMNVETVQLNDRLGVKTTQKICGLDELDIIDEIEVIWKYENEKWEIKEAKGVKIGNLLY